MCTKLLYRLDHITLGICACIQTKFVNRAWTDRQTDPYGLVWTDYLVHLCTHGRMGINCLFITHLIPDEPAKSSSPAIKKARSWLNPFLPRLPDSLWIQDQPGRFILIFAGARTWEKGTADKCGGRACMHIYGWLPGWTFYPHKLPWKKLSQIFFWFNFEDFLCGYSFRRVDWVAVFKCFHPGFIYFF